jgi:hypothetical protein
MGLCSHDITAIVFLGLSNIKSIKSSLQFLMAVKFCMGVAIVGFVCWNAHHSVE